MVMHMPLNARQMKQYLDSTGHGYNSAVEHMLGLQTVAASIPYSHHLKVLGWQVMWSGLTYVSLFRRMAG